MQKPQFMYVVYISSTPENVWNALIDGEMTKQYWGHHRNASDWNEGSRWTHEDFDDSSLVDIVGVVVQSDPPRRLVLTWARPVDADNEARHSRVTFDVEQYEDAVRLTVVHDNADPEMLESVSGGWPIVLSSLKTLLETGKPMAMTTRRHAPPPE